MGKIKLNKLWNSVKKRGKKAVKSHRLYDRRLWMAAGGAILLLIFWILPATAGRAPGQLGYSLKRGEEAMISNLAPLHSWRDRLRLDFANNRVSEAAYVADRLNSSDNKDQTKATKTINQLLSSYKTTYESRLAALNKDLEQGKKPAKSSLRNNQSNIVNSYTRLQLLRLQAPDTSQLMILSAIDNVQQYLAVTNDALGIPPLGASDFAQLAKLVPVGVISQSQVDQLSNVLSSRQLHAKIKTLIEGGQLPSDLSYILDLDTIKQFAPKNVAVFETVAQFEQMQRISAVISAARPTAAQKQAIQAFLANYKAGQALPNSDIQPYVSAVVYGMALSGQLQTNLPNLNAVRLSGDDQALLDSWKGVIDPPNLADTYQKIITNADSQPSLRLRLLSRTQAELVYAQKAQIAYLVMPPGWSASQMASLDQLMGVEIAEANYQAAKPNTNQELAQITIVQSQLRNSLTELQATHSQTVASLQTHINNFSGTPEQIGVLKDQLNTLEQTYSVTVNNLQNQINNIANAHSKLGDSITSLRQEQLTNLAELEMRAANTAKNLSDAAKSQLSATINQISTSSQNLINNLTAKVDDLGASHSDLRNHLTGEITAIKANYQELKTDVQAQLGAGVAVSGNLQNALNQVKSDLATQTTNLTNLSSKTTALSGLVDQVKGDSQSGLNDLSQQVDTIKLGQQTIQTAVSDLQTISQNSQNLISGLQSRVDSLGAGQSQLRQSLTADLQTVRDDYTSVIAAVQAQVDAGVATSANLTSTLQTVQSDLTSHTAQLTSLAGGTSALTNLVNQVQASANTQAGELQGQIDGLNISQQNVKNSIADLKTKQASDIADLNNQLADLRVVQVEAGAAIADIIQTQVSIRADTNNLGNNFDSLQRLLDNSLEAQASLEADVSNQQSELDSLSAQTQSAIDVLTAQQTVLGSQLSGLAGNVTSLNQTISTVQTAAGATQTQLDNLLATPPWAIPNGTYVSQSDFDTLSASLNVQFAQKSAQLDAQFQAYQTTLNASVNQLTTQVNGLNSNVNNLSTTVTNNQTNLQNQVNTLNSQVQTLQQQVQQLLHPGGL